MDTIKELKRKEIEYTKKRNLLKSNNLDAEFYEEALSKIRIDIAQAKDGKSKQTRFRVIINNGKKIIDCEHAKETYIDFFKYVGITKVASEFPSCFADKSLKETNSLVYIANRLYLKVGLSNKDKITNIKKIAAKYSISVSVTSELKR